MSILLCNTYRNCQLLVVRLQSAISMYYRYHWYYLRCMQYCSRSLGVCWYHHFTQKSFSRNSKLFQRDMVPPNYMSWWYTYIYMLIKKYIQPKPSNTIPRDWTSFTIYLLWRTVLPIPLEIRHVYIFLKIYILKFTLTSHPQCSSRPFVRVGEEEKLLLVCSTTHSHF